MKLTILTLAIIMSIACAMADVVSKEMTRFASDYTLKTSFFEDTSAYNIFDSFSLYDLDDKRIADVYVYSKNPHWLGRNNELKYFLEDSVREYSLIQTRLADLMNNSKATEASNELIVTMQNEKDDLFRVISGYDEFITVITSSTRRRLPIWEFKKGLPDMYYRDYLDGISITSTPSHMNQIKYYYNGPMQLFVEDDLGYMVNINNHGVKVKRDALAGHLFRHIPVENEFLDKCTKSWHVIEAAINEGFITLPHSNRNAYFIPEVPYFRQGDWNLGSHNLFPNGGSCGVMSHASAFFYHDTTPYWNMVPFAWKTGGNYQCPTAGFASHPGIGYTFDHPVNGNMNLDFGLEPALIDLANAIGYNYSNGGTIVNPFNFTSNLANYTNSMRGFNFSFDLQTNTLVTNPHSYNEIKSQINSNRPMTIIVTQFSWDDALNNFNVSGDHAVAIVAYSDSHPIANQAIGVYTNGSWDYYVVYWNYNNLVSSQGTWNYLPYTISITPGGTSGTWINPPVAINPYNYSSVATGIVNFNWQNVNASQYWLQVSSSSNFSSYIINGTTSSTNINQTINTPGTYYWRVAPKNSSGNWCHFSDTIPFSVVSNHTISGTVTRNGTGLSGVTLNGFPTATTTNASGAYSCTVNHGWSGTVTPTRTGYTFTPQNRSYTNVTSNQSNQNYTAALVTYTISGTVTHNGSGLSGVTLSGFPTTTTTNDSGAYSCTVNHGWSGTVTPILDGYIFTPQSITYSSVITNQSNQNYDASTVSNHDALGTPVATEIKGNYPNPFNPTTTIEYTVKYPSNVSVVVYNSRGAIVKKLVSAHKATGHYQVIWNGSDDRGYEVSSGVYFIVLKADSIVSCKKILLMK